MPMWLRSMFLAGLILCHAVSPVAAQTGPPKTPAQQMAIINALIERSKLIPQINQLSFDSRYGEALPLAMRLVELTQPAFEAAAADTAWALEQLARVHEGLGRYPEAERAMGEAIRIRSGLGGGAADTNLAEDRNRLAVTYEAQGRIGDAERLYALGRSGGAGARPDAVATRLNYLSVLREGQGRYGEAEMLAKRTLALRQQLLGSEHADVALTLNNLAMIYWAQGRRAEVEPLLQRAIAIVEKQRGRDHPETGRLIANLADIIDDPARERDVEALYKRTIAIQEKASGPEHRSVLIGLNNLAAFYRERGRLTEADGVQGRVIGLIEASLERYKGNELIASFLELPTFHARALTLHARIRVDQGQHDQALAMLEKALALEEKTRGREHPAVATVLVRMGAVHAAKERWPAAMAAFARASEIHIGRLRAAGATERQGAQQGREKDNPREAFLGLATAALRQSEGAAPDRRRALIEEAFRAAQWAERSSAGAALSRMSARFAAGSDALAKVARERQDLIEESVLADRQLSGLLAGTPSPQTLAQARTLRERIAAIDVRLAAIDQRLKAEFAGYFALVNPEPAAVAEVQRLIGAEEVLIQYAIGPSESIAWAFSRGGVQAARIPLGEAALARKVEMLRCGLDQVQWEVPAQERRCLELLGTGKSEAGLPFHLGTAHELYAALLAPFETAFRGKQLLIVPAGPLASLPFGVLVAAAPAAPLARAAADYRQVAWLGTRQAITVLPSVVGLRALRAMERTGRAEKPLTGFANPILVGDPDLPAHVERARLARAKQRCPAGRTQLAGGVRPLRAIAPFARHGRVELADVLGQVPLPETTDELCAVASSVGAAESDLRLGGRATETEVKRMSASGELARYRVLHFATHAAVSGEVGGAAEPGLILTPPSEASDADDGYLSASEIAQLKLNADWVVLSACNTAAGNARDAEALSGLARSFFYAGARSLLVSHWAVDSNATVRLITKAFEEMRAAETAGRPIARAEALRRSIAAMLDAGQPAEAHPAYWAPFVVVGEGAAP